MSNIALYRKWRPKTFDEVVEQEHVVRTLKNSILTGRLAHAYLFCGTRGTGKTSLAQILSRAVNCLNPSDANPCNTCGNCTGILTGSMMDVVEIDAASNNSVDNIRQLKDDIIYPPIQAPYKVYIIDEVHMLSGGAFNALLKTLEEPPSYVVFILATTEPHKLPATILSRCQRYDFRRITNDAIANHLRVIVQDAGACAQEDALTLIAKLSDGAMRDAISILDQCLSASDGVLTREIVMQTIGLSGDRFLCSTAQLVHGEQVASVPAHVAQLLASGKDLKQYVSELIRFFRDLAVIKFGASQSDFPEVQDDIFAEMKVLAASADHNHFFSIIDELSELEGRMKYSHNQSILLEIALSKLCLGNYRTPEAITTLNTRLAAIEKKLASLSAIPPSPPQSGATPQPTVQIPAQAGTDVQRSTQVSPLIGTSTQNPTPTPTPTQLTANTAEAAVPQPQPQRQAAAMLPTPQTIQPAQSGEMVRRDAVLVSGQAKLAAVEERTWISMVDQLKKNGSMDLFSMLQDSESYRSQNKFYIALKEKMNPHKVYLNTSGSIQKLKQLVKEMLGQDLSITILTSLETEEFLATTGTVPEDAPAAAADLVGTAPTVSMPTGTPASASTDAPDESPASETVDSPTPEITENAEDTDPAGDPADLPWFVDDADLESTPGSGPDSGFDSSADTDSDSAPPLGSEQAIQPRSRIDELAEVLLREHPDLPVNIYP